MEDTGFVNTEVGSGKVYHVIVRGQAELSFSQAEQPESVSDTFSGGLEPT